MASREGWCLSIGSFLLQDTGAQWRSPRSIHVGKDGLCGRVDARLGRLGRRPRFQGDRRPRVNFPCWPEIPRVKLTPDRLFWRTPGKLQLMNSLGQNPHELLLEVWRPRAIHLIGLRSRPILPLRDRDGHGVLPLLLAKGYKLLDVSRGVEAILGEGNWGIGRPLGLTVRQDDAPATRRGGPPQQYAGGSGPHPD